MALTRIGTEWQKNALADSVYSVLTNGNIVVIDAKPLSGGAGQVLVGQIYTPTGNAVGASFTIQSFASGSFGDLAVTRLADGRFAVAWTCYSSGSNGPFVETGIFNANGSVFKAPVQIGSGNVPILTSLADGGFAMVYNHGGTKTIAFNKDGVAGAVSAVSNEYAPSIAGLRGGGYVMVAEEPSASGSGTEIKAYLRLPNGTAKEILIKAFPGDVEHYSRVVGLANGNFVVTWTAEYTDGSSAIKAQIVSPNGALVGGEVTLSTENNAFAASLEALPDGGFAIAALKFSNAAFDYDVYVGTYSATGAVVTAPMLAHQNTDNWQLNPNIEVLKDGTLLVGWQNSVPGGYTYNYQAFSTGYVVPAGTDLLNTFGFIRTGTKNKDKLAGGAGNDKFYGGSGNDTLTGLDGADVFVFNAKLGTAKTDRKVNFDTITDFKPGVDKLWLDDAIFKKLGKDHTETAPAALNKKNFKIGKQAGDKNDYIVYDKKTGILSYDPDGSGVKAAIEIAKLARNLKLNYLDFAIV